MGSGITMLFFHHVQNYVFCNTLLKFVVEAVIVVKGQPSLYLLKFVLSLHKIHGGDIRDYNYSHVSNYINLPFVGDTLCKSL